MVLVCLTKVMHWLATWCYGLHNELGPVVLGTVCA